MPKRGRPSFAALAAAEAESAAAVSAATPSKKLKGSAAGQTVTDAAASAQLAEQVQDDSSSINFGLVQQVHDALGVINGNPVFTNIIEQLPLTHDEGGSQVPFCQESLSTALSGDGEGRVYLCGGQLLLAEFHMDCQPQDACQPRHHQGAPELQPEADEAAATLPVHDHLRCGHTDGGRVCYQGRAAAHLAA